MSDLRAKNRLLELLVELLDIPPSHYVKAKDRARSLGEYLLRPESAVADFNPDVYPQGSFRYGTVIRPLLKSDEYDLDLVCALGLSKYDVTQKYVKELLGGEIQSYARAKQFKEPAEEKPRCWRLNYADDVSFHMDIVPSVPEDAGTIKLIVARQVPAQLAEHAIAITDQRHPRYTAVDPSWFSSNPRGVAAWFEDQMRQVAEARMRELVLEARYAAVEEVPAYEWKTTLQRAIQILKRHRDVMFQKHRDFAPISMIITTLAAHAYGGERDLYSALTNILLKMPDFVRGRAPRIPNPVNPAEDFADRWATDARYEKNFWAWHTQASADVQHLCELIGAGGLRSAARQRLAVELSDEQLRSLDRTVSPAVPRVIAAAPVLQIPSAPRPWGG